jgi:hypothetical protein
MDKATRSIFFKRQLTREAIRELEKARALLVGAA